MKVNDVINVIERIAPEYMACEWDNVGLLVGSRFADVKKVFVCLDCTNEAIDEAIDAGADMIVSHHPLIFSPLHAVNDDNFIAKRVLRLAKEGIAYYASHTSFDCGKMGILAAERLGLIDTEILDVEGATASNFEYGIGMVGTVNSTGTMTVKDLAELTKSSFDIPGVTVYGQLDKPIKRVAISPGSGKSEIDNAVAKNADIIITGDIDHHSGIDALAKGIAVIDAGHFGIESIFIDYMSDYLNDLDILAIPQKKMFSFTYI